MVAKVANDEDPVSDSDVDSSADPHDVDYSLLTSDHVM